MITELRKIRLELKLDKISGIYTVTSPDVPGQVQIEIEHQGVLDLSDWEELVVTLKNLENRAAENENSEVVPATSDKTPSFDEGMEEVLNDRSEAWSRLAKL